MFEEFHHTLDKHVRDVSNMHVRIIGQVEHSRVEWSGVEWSGVEWSGVEWSGVE